MTGRRTEVLACPAEYWFTDEGYGRSYNLFRHFRADDVHVDVHVDQIDVDAPFDAESVAVTAADTRSHLRYFGDAFLRAAREARHYDVYHHMHVGYRTFNPVLLAHLEGETPVLLGPVEGGHDVPPAELRTIVDRSVPDRLPDAVTDVLYGVGRVGLRSVVDPARESLFRRTVDAADRVVAVHDDAREVYARYTDPAKVEVVPYGVNLERFTFAERPDTRDLLVVGNLIERKGHRHLIEAMPAVAEAFPDATLHVVGEGPELASLRALASDLGVAGNVAFHGRVSTESLRAHLRDARAFVHPSLSEGFSHVRLEAMASGCPVVGTDVAGARELTRDGTDGFVVPAGDPDALAEAAVELLGDLSLARELGRNARRKVERDHDWADVARRYADIYRELAR